MKQQSEPASPWSPFQQVVFRNLWLANVGSNVGTWMQSVGAAWLMTGLSKSPVMVALVQAAATLPLFLPAGRWPILWTSAACCWSPRPAAARAPDQSRPGHGKEGPNFPPARPAARSHPFTLCLWRQGPGQKKIPAEPST